MRRTALVPVGADVAVLNNPNVANPIAKRPSQRSLRRSFMRVLEVGTARPLRARPILPEFGLASSLGSAGFFEAIDVQGPSWNQSSDWLKVFWA